MIKKKKRTKNIVGIIIFLIVISCLCLYFFVIKDNSVKELFNNLNNKINLEEISESEIQSILDNELTILDNKEKISDITNQEKLWYSYVLMVNDIGYNEIFSAEILKEYFDKSSLSYLGLVIESFSCYGEADHPYLFIYNEETNEYTPNTNHGGHGATLIGKVYSKIIDIDDDNHKYTVTVKSLWTKSSEGYVVLNVYGSLNDAKEETNSLGSINIEKNSSIIQGKEFIDSNYSSIEDKLDTYLYVFEKVDGKIKLVEYEKK